MKLYLRTLAIAYFLASLCLLFVLTWAIDAEAEMATYYADSYAGSLTASGEPYDPGAFTAAHPGYAMGTELEVCRVDGGGCVQVVVTDSCGCSIDLSRAAMAAIGGIDAGVLPVTVTVL